MKGDRDGYFGCSIILRGTHPRKGLLERNHYSLSRENGLPLLPNRVQRNTEVQVL
jgi:hypothetical protein